MNSLTDILKKYKNIDTILFDYIYHENDFNGLCDLTNFLIKKEKYEKNKEKAILFARSLNKIKFAIWLKDPNIKLYKERDFVSEYYKSMTKNGDKCISKVSFFYNDNSIFSLEAGHEEVSGFSLINEMLDTLRLSDLSEFKNFKKKKDSKLIIYFYLIKNLLNLIFKKRLKSYDWRFFKSNKESFENNFVKISRKDTLNFMKKARFNKGSFFDALLFLLNNRFMDELLNKKEDTNWLIPVPEKPLNLVGKFYSNSYNDYSFLPIKIYPSDEISSINSRIKKEKKNKSWLRVYLEIYFYLKLNYKNYLYNIFFKNNSSFGSFSYFGIAHSPFSTKDYIVGNTFPTKSCPITVSFGIINGELIVSYNIHYNLLKNKKHLEDINNKIEKDILSYE